MGTAHRKAKVINQYGIHCRPSAMIAKEMAKYPDCQFVLNVGNGDVPIGIDGSSAIMGLMTLGAECGQTVDISVTGDQAEEACNKVAELLATDFDFQR